MSISISHLHLYVYCQVSPPSRVIGVEWPSLVVGVALGVVTCDWLITLVCHWEWCHVILSRLSCLSCNLLSSVCNLLSRLLGHTSGGASKCSIYPRLNALYIPVYRVYLPTPLLSIYLPAPV